MALNPKRNIIVRNSKNVLLIRLPLLASRQVLTTPINKTALPLCTLIQKGDPFCYSRNIELAGNLIFEPATLVVNIIALIMTAIMIYYIKQKYTAVGRKEIGLHFTRF